MTIEGFGKAALRLAAVFAVAGVLLALLATAVTPNASIDPLAIAVLAGALAVAGAIVVLIAMLSDWVLRERVPDDDTRMTVITAIAAGLVLLSGLTSVASLGILSLAVTGVLALLTHLVLTRTLT